MSEKPLDVVLCARQSVASANSMSPEIQIEMGRTEGGKRNWNIVAEIVDDDVSGSVDPLQRPHLGPLLSGRGPRFDAIAFPRIDRASRDTLDGLLLLRALEIQNKRLIILSPYMDSSTMTPIERVHFVLGLEMGSYERQKIIANVREGVVKNRQMGKWLGGKVPLWCKVVPHSSGKGWQLDLDEKLSVLMLEIIDRIMAGPPYEPYFAIAADLTERGIPIPDELRNNTKTLTEKGGKDRRPNRPWMDGVIKRIGRNRLLIGQKEVVKHEYVNGKRRKEISREIVRDEVTQEPILFCPPLIDFDKYMRLQAILDTPRAKTPKKLANPLQSVVYCLDCGAMRYAHRAKRKDKDRSPDKDDYAYFVCSTRTRFKACTGGSNVGEKTVYEYLEANILDVAGDSEVYDYIPPPREDYESRLLVLRDESESLTRLYLAKKSQTERTKLEARIALVDAEIAELEQKELNPPKGEYVATGKVFAKLWHSADWKERGNLLRGIGVTIACTARSGTFIADLRLPEDFRARLRDVTSGVGVEPHPLPASSPWIAEDELVRARLRDGQKTKAAPAEAGA